MRDRWSKLSMTRRILGRLGWDKSSRRGLDVAARQTSIPREHTVEGFRVWREKRGASGGAWHAPMRMSSSCRRGFGSSLFNGSWKMASSGSGGHWISLSALSRGKSACVTLMAASTISFDGRGESEVIWLAAHVSTSSTSAGRWNLTSVRFIARYRAAAVQRTAGGCAERTIERDTWDTGTWALCHCRFDTWSPSSLAA